MSTASRETILARVRHALADVPAASPEEDTPVPWTYAQATQVGDVLDLFEERVVDYKAAFERTSAGQVPATVARALQAHQVASVVLPSGLDSAIAQAVGDAGIRVMSDEPLLSNADLNEVSAVVTAAAVGAAETGTIVLDHAPDQGRRALSLVPDVHVCVIRADQVVTDVPEAVARLHGALAAGQPLTWISGGSATSDIELSRVEGVHGPRTLHVVLVTD